MILPLLDTSVAPSSMISASAPSIYSVQALSLLAEVSRNSFVVAAPICGVVVYWYY